MSEINGAPNQCWICGKTADSSEHKAKASDVKNILGTPTQKKPFYLRGNDELNKKINGIKVDLLKWEEKICSSCNNAVSSPYDKAWEKLSNYLLTVPKGVKNLNLEHIYGEDHKLQSLLLHLYFMKVLGFGIVAANANIPLGYFQHGLLNKTAHPDLYLRVAFFHDWPINQLIHISDLHTINDRFGPYLAVLAYGVGPWLIYMAHWLPRGPKPEMVQNGFHPNKPTKYISVSTFK